MGASSCRQLTLPLQSFYALIHRQLVPRPVYVLHHTTLYKSLHILYLADISFNSLTSRQSRVLGQRLSAPDYPLNSSHKIRIELRLPRVVLITLTIACWAV